MSSPPRAHVVAPILVGGAAALVFWRTAYPTITWWDSSNYSLAAATFGVTSPPGSLMLTLIGWIATRLPMPFETAFTLNLLAGLLAALASVLVMIVALRLYRLLTPSVDAPGLFVTSGAAVGALVFAFSATLWEHAVKFTPYVLTVVFTGLLLLTLARWWEVADQPESWRWIALLTFLFGLDFSVHRTNAVLMPGAIAWILVRHPRTLLPSRSWLAALGGMSAGLTFHLLVIPISGATSSPLNMFQPDSVGRFWDYVSLAQTGGNFQLTLWPRNSPFWSNQVADLLSVFGANFAHHASAVSVAGWLPLLTGIGGISFMFRRNARLAAAFLLLWFTQIAATVIYFNIPENFFRSLDRHYLPVLFTFAVAIAIGAGAATQVLAAWWKRKPVWTAEAAAVLAFIPVAQLVANWQANDASQRHFTRDYAVNVLQALPPNAFYFTVGDNDTFPVMYMQAVEGVRPDVRIINLSLANTDWYIEQFRRRDPTFPVTGTSDERRKANASIWKDSSLVLPTAESADTLRRADARRDSLVFTPRPAYGGEPLPADDVFLDIVRAAGFSSPVTIAMTGGASAVAWLQPFVREDGMHWRLIAMRNPARQPDLLRENLLREKQYRGYADSSVVIDDVTRRIGLLYLNGFRALLEAEMAAGNVAGCQDVYLRVSALLPAARLAQAGEPSPSIEGICRR